MPRENKKPKKRLRRTAEEARLAILDATEHFLLKEGPDRIRLQDVAAEVGISHPAILHHFRSRDELVKAVLERAMQNLERDLVAAFIEGDGLANPHEIVLRVVKALTDRGYGRVMAWLLLTNQDLGYDEQAQIRTIATAVHENRSRRLRERGVAVPPFEDTWFAVSTIGLTLFAESLYGPEGAHDDPEISRRYHAWLSTFLHQYLDG